MTFEGLKAQICNWSPTFEDTLCAAGLRLTLLVRVKCENMFCPSPPPPIHLPSVRNSRMDLPLMIFLMKMGTMTMMEIVLVCGQQFVMVTSKDGKTALQC